MTTLLLTTVLVGILVVAGLSATMVLSVRGYARRQLGDARAEARRWVERLGGELLVLDGIAARAGAAGPVGLAEAAERFTCAGSELAVAATPRQCRLAQQTAVEGLHHIRTARAALGLDAGPTLAGGAVRSALRSAASGGGTRVGALVEAVLSDLRARSVTSSRPDPGDWARYWTERWSSGPHR